MGKETYLIVRNNGLGIWKFLKKREPEDACHPCTHYRLEIFGKLLNECEPEGGLLLMHPL